MTTNAVLFGELLRHYREVAPLTQEALARQIHCDRSLVARVEAGTRVPSEAFAKKCDEVLETGGALGRLWGKIDWYQKVEHPDWFERRAQMDAQAVELFSYQERMIPGLLQTEDYAWAQFSQVLGRDETDVRVRARLSRQQRFLTEDGPLFIAVLDESCLRTVMGSPAIMRDQCAHLLRVGRRPNIRVQVAPSWVPDLVRPNTSMSLITLPGGERWAYSESLDNGHFSSDPAVLERHRRTYDVLRADVLSARESAALISDAMEGYEHDEQPRTRRDDLGQEQLQRQQRRRLRRSRPRVHLHPRPRA
ncbi:helix-turn-helix transcriptional regulator [Streptomyces sp. NPDC046942]|uniref:helix-turn-helix domain-containing protein n=1 Tax=Streptomyces sp. NPDC046942 TaxID=3155137 RepID=UPI003401642E